MTPDLQKTEDKIIDNEQFLLLTELEQLKVEYLNETACSFFGIESTSIGSDDFQFYSKFLHPEDQEKYRSHLRSIEGEEEKEIELRVKNKNGGWKTFQFRDRLYHKKNGATKAKILTLACPADRKNTSKSNLAEKGSGYAPKNDYEKLLYSLDEGFCVVELIYDSDGEPIDFLYLKTNPAFEQHVHLQNVTGRTAREIIPGLGRKWMQSLEEVKRTGESRRVQYYSEDLDKTWFDTFVLKIGGADSNKMAMLFRNITEKKHQEQLLQEEFIQQHEDLQESKELLQTVFDTTNLAIAVMKTVYDEAGNIKDFEFLRLNEVAQRLYLKEDIVGRTYLDVSKHGVKMGIFEAYKKVMETGEAFDKEFYFGKDGYNHWFRVTARAQNNLLITTVENITERKAKAQELEEMVRFKQELVRTTPEVIMIINLNSNTIRYINKDIVPEIGLTREELLGKPIPEIIPLVHPRDREKAMNLHRTLLKSTEEEIIDLEVRLKLDAVQWDWFNVRGKVFKRKNDKWVDEYVLLVRNITEQKNTQKALLRAEKLSIQGEVARTFAHELRNPLASIGMVGEMLNTKYQRSEEKELATYLKILQRSTSTLNKLVTDLLTASNYTPPDLKEEDLGAIVESTLKKAADRIYLSGMKVEKKYRGNYPVLADKEKLEIALLNLLVNASEATTPGKGIIEIEISEKEHDFVLRITDNGIGMEKEQLDHLFEAFYTQKESGMGIGMSSVKNILDEHDAKIKVTSTPGEGTTFRIFLPNLLHS